MKYSSGVESASVSYLGTDEHIDEFVLFANSKDWLCCDTGLGTDMNLILLSH
jgi:hypothetical protein